MHPDQAEVFAFAVIMYTALIGWAVVGRFLLREASNTRHRIYRKVRYFLIGIVLILGLIPSLLFASFWLEEMLVIQRAFAAPLIDQALDEQCDVNFLSAADGGFDRRSDGGYEWWDGSSYVFATCVWTAETRSWTCDC